MSLRVVSPKIRYEKPVTSPGSRDEKQEERRLRWYDGGESMRTKDAGYVQKVDSQEIGKVLGDETLTRFTDFFQANQVRLLEFAKHMARHLGLSVEDGEDAVQVASQSLQADSSLNPANFDAFIRRRIGIALLDMRRLESRRARIADKWRLDFLRNQSSQPELVVISQSLRSLEEGLNPAGRDNIDLAIQSSEKEIEIRRLLDRFKDYLRDDEDRLTLYALWLHQAIGYEWSEVKTILGWPGELGTLRKRAHDLRKRLHKAIKGLIAQKGILKKSKSI
jgi:hypothetical protein